ncbi:MAG: DUF2238 domain-containing protein [Phycisphaerales bacterium]|nr:DUF2238 domain-containing protein [Phycisphaerales bacterium]
MTDARPDRTPLFVMLGVSAAALIWSGSRPADRQVWVFEVSLGTVGVLLLTATWGRFRFSTLVYVLATIHFVILAIGGKYTYADMPLFNWLRDALHLSRNHYDRVGHFAQGFIPAIIVREILLRCTPLQRGRMSAVLVVAMCLAMSALYELIEWWIVVVFYPDEGPSWLGLQGDVWDAHWDMTMALLGACLSLVLLGRVHDRSMRRLAR